MRPKGIQKGRQSAALRGNRNAVRAVKRKRLHTTVAPETLEYIISMSKNSSRGDLIDAAIKLYREVNESSASEST